MGLAEKLLRRFCCAQTGGDALRFSPKLPFTAEIPHYTFEIFRLWTISPHFPLVTLKIYVQGFLPKSINNLAHRS